MSCFNLLPVEVWGIVTAQFGDDLRNLASLARTCTFFRGIYITLLSKDSRKLGALFRMVLSSARPESIDKMCKRFPAAKYTTPYQIETSSIRGLSRILEKFPQLISLNIHSWREHNNEISEFLSMQIPHSLSKLRLPIANTTREFLEKFSQPPQVERAIHFYYPGSPIRCDLYVSFKQNRIELSEENSPDAASFRSLQYSSLSLHFIVLKARSMADQARHEKIPYELEDEQRKLEYIKKAREDFEMSMCK